ncbi:MAG: phage minor capsid protein [Acutalibacteraceae bacterium]
MNDFDKEIAEIYKDMELEMIKSMKRNLGLHIAEEAKTGIDYPQWQAIKIREMRKYQRQNKSLLKNSRRGMDKDIKDHIRDEMKQGSLHEMKRFKKAKGAGYKSAVAMKDSFFKINTKKVDSLINSVHSDFARADQAILRMMNDTYRSTIFKYGMYVSNGVYTEKQAYDAAVKDFLSRGLNCIEYKDGRRVNIADYTSMAIRTVNQRAYMAGEGEVRKQLGETLVIISKHATSCPLCQPFENKVLIDDVYSGGKADDGDYMLLSQAMAEGLFHPRCRHGLGTYYPELEDIVHYDTEENRVNEYGTDKLNKAHIENMIQKYKRLTVGSIDPENIAKYQAKLDEWENKKAQLGIANSEGKPTLHEQNKNNQPLDNLVLENKGNYISNSYATKELSGSDLFTDEKKKQLYRHERILTGNNYETAIVYDSEGNVLFKKKGNRDEVQFSKSELSKLKGKVVTHNHPQNSCFSADDITLMYQNQLAEVRACNNFGTYVIRPTKNTLKISKNKLDKKMDVIYNEVGSKYRDIAAQNGKSILDYLIDVDNEVMERIAKEYNLYYRWEPIK